MVVDCYEAHPPGGKDPLQIAAHLDVVPAESGQILHQDAVDRPPGNVVLHPAKGGAVEIGAGEAVVLVKVHQAQLWMGRDILFQQLTLIGDAVALRLVPVLSGQAQIACRVPPVHDRPISFLSSGSAGQVLWARASARTSASGPLSPSKRRTTRQVPSAGVVVCDAMGPPPFCPTCPMVCGGRGKV